MNLEEIASFHVIIIRGEWNSSWSNFILIRTLILKVAACKTFIQKIKLNIDSVAIWNIILCWEKWMKDSEGFIPILIIHFSWYQYDMTKHIVILHGWFTNCNIKNKIKSFESFKWDNVDSISSQMQITFFWHKFSTKKVTKSLPKLLLKTGENYHRNVKLYIFDVRWAVFWLVT